MNNTSKKPSTPGRLNARRDLREFDGRLRLLIVLFAIPILGLVWRMYKLQVAQGEYYYELSNDNFVRESELTPNRGLIYDRNGTIIADNRPVYDAYITPEVFGENEAALDLLEQILNLSESRRAWIDRRLAGDSLADILVGRDVTRNQLAMLETNASAIPSLFVRVRQHRTYPLNDLVAHLIGYMNEVSEDELGDLRRYGYRRGDYVGRNGIEHTYEAVMRGAPGLRRRVINAHGHTQDEETARQLLGDYQEVAPVPGKNLHLTLDIGLQQAMEERLRQEHSAAAVAVDPRDGSIIGLFSEPTFDPNAWSGRLTPQEYAEINANPYHPMMNKAIVAWFPGSTYKVVTAFAALEEGVFDPETRIHCSGQILYGGRPFRCWNRGGHGWMNLRSALSNSCDIYFYEAGMRLGMDTLANYAYDFGFGATPGLGLQGEQAGVVPTREWHERNSEMGFVGGLTLSTAVGQGDTRISPVHLAMAYAAIANDGTVFYPRLVDRVTTADEHVVFEYPARVRRRLPYSDLHMDLVQEGLVAVVAEGTARSLAFNWMNVAGKTGTAQVASLSSLRLRDNEVIWKQRDHAWFVAYAPVEDPRIVVSVIVEHGGQGSRVAAPIAFDILDAYFRDVLELDEEVEAAQVSSRGRAELQNLLAMPVASELAGGDLMRVDMPALLHLGQAITPDML